MIEEGQEAFDDPYLYPGTTVLRNLHAIQDKAAHFPVPGGTTFNISGIQHPVTLL